MANIMMDNSAGNPYIVRSKTVIGEGVFIGRPSLVYPRVTIGNQCIVLPVSVVTKDVQSNAMVDEAYTQAFLNIKPSL